VKITITGPDGLLGNELMREYLDAGASVDPLFESEVDLTDESAVEAHIHRIKPEVIIHTAAYTNVDGAEDDRDKAFNVNAFGTYYLCKAARHYGTRVVYLSTDYVFDGSGIVPLKPTDETNPRSVYAQSKLAGEMFTKAYSRHWMIIRTSSLYGIHGVSFADKLCRRAATGEPLRVVSDQIISPTYAADLAKGILALVEQGDDGIYHLTNQGETNWFEFAKEIARRLELPNGLLAISTAELGLKAPRPRYSVLDNSAAQELGVTLRPWQEALDDYLSLHGEALKELAQRTEEQET